MDRTDGGMRYKENEGKRENRRMKGDWGDRSCYEAKAFAFEATRCSVLGVVCDKSKAARYSVLGDDFKSTSIPNQPTRCHQPIGFLF